MQKLNTEGVSALMQKLNTEGASALMQKLNTEGVSALMQKLNTEGVSALMQKLNAEGVSALMQKLNAEGVSALIERIARGDKLVYAYINDDTLTWLKKNEKEIQDHLATALNVSVSGLDYDGAYRLAYKGSQYSQWIVAVISAASTTCKGGSYPTGTYMSTDSMVSIKNGQITLRNALGSGHVLLIFPRRCWS